MLAQKPVAIVALFALLLYAAAAPAAGAAPASPKARPADKSARPEGKAATVAPQAPPTAEPAGKQPSDDGGKVPVKVIADGDDMQLSLVSDHSQPVACDTPCLARVLPGRLSLLPPRGTDPQNVIIDGPTTVTLVPGSRPKLVGGIVLMVVGAALFAVAIGGGMSGDVGALPAIVLAAAGGGAMGGGGSLFSSSGGSVSVERGVK